MSRFEIQMPYLSTVLGVSTAFLVLGCAPEPPPGEDASPPAEESSFVAPDLDASQNGALFTGDFSGWEGSRDWFRIEGDAVVAGSLEHALDHNEFLCTLGTWGDFELRLQVKLRGGSSANAGVQFRSRRVADSSEVEGYQADMGEGFWGSLYDESRRERVLAAADQEPLAALVSSDAWIDYRIRAQGQHIELFLDGERTVEYTETEQDLPVEGHICLQIHAGPPAEAWYRNLEIESL